MDDRGVMTRELTGAGFDVDLRHGQAREEALVHVFLQSRVEVKSDKRARKTGNVFVEFHDHQKNAGQGGPSGINVTTAHYWAFEVDEHHWIIVPTERVKTLCDRAAFERGTVRGGDFNRSEGVLIPLQWLIRQ
jgi:hypothetical protein